MFSNIASGQSKITTKYYDSTMIQTSKDSAYFECDFSLYDDLYICSCYWKSTKDLCSISLREDTSIYSKKYGVSLEYYQNHRIKDSVFYYPEGGISKQYKYYENGQLSDSMFYNTKGKIDSGFNFYSNGKLKAKYIYNSQSQSEKLLALSESGDEIKNVKYSEEASFSGGESAWRRYLQQNLDPLTPVKNGAKEGIYQVVVRFIVQKDGTIRDIKAETNHGYGMEDEVLRLLKKSPKWKPAIFLGESIEAYRRQPVTFVVQSQ
jgi:hypothetical protein